MSDRKYFAVLLCVIMVFSLSGCHKENEEPTGALSPSASPESTENASVGSTDISKLSDSLENTDDMLNDTSDAPQSSAAPDSPENIPDETTVPHYDPQTAAYPDIKPRAEKIAQQIQDSDFRLNRDEQLSRINYYNSDGFMLYYAVYTYYDDGRLCGMTLYEEIYTSWDFPPLTGTEYSLLCLYENDSLSGIMLDAHTISAWYDETTGEVILDIEIDASTKQSKHIVINPAYESIEQEKYGIDPEKTEEIYGNAQIIFTDKSREWSTAYLDAVFDSQTNDEMACRFLYLNDDSIPELEIDYRFGPAGYEIYTASNNVTDSFSYYYGGAYWIENGNLMLIKSGKMDDYYDYIYQIKDGKFDLLAEGRYGKITKSPDKVDENGKPIYDYEQESETSGPIYKYYWNGVEMSEEEYNRQIISMVDKENADDGYNDCAFTYKQCKRLLEMLADN